MKIRGNIWFVLLIFFIGIFGGSAIYHYIELWEWIDSIYFVVATVTTIGYGDFVPTTNLGKVFTMFYSFFGVAIALYLISSINASIFKKHVGQKVSEIKRDVKKEQNIKKDIKNTLKKAVSKKR